jgi:hypothetical protein
LDDAIIFTAKTDKKAIHPATAVKLELDSLFFQLSFDWVGPDYFNRDHLFGEHNKLLNLYQE